MRLFEGLTTLARESNFSSVTLDLSGNPLFPSLSSSGKGSSKGATGKLKSFSKLLSFSRGTTKNLFKKFPVRSSTISKPTKKIQTMKTSSNSLKHNKQPLCERRRRKKKVNKSSSVSGAIISSRKSPQIYKFLQIFLSFITEMKRMQQFRYFLVSKTFPQQHSQSDNSEKKNMMELLWKIYNQEHKKDFQGEENHDENKKIGASTSSIQVELLCNRFFQDEGEMKRFNEIFH
jgi:hypothetical protein